MQNRQWTSVTGKAVKSLSSHGNTVFMAAIARFECGRLVVPTGWGNQPHCPWNNYNLAARKIPYSSHLSQRRSELATEIMWFDTMRLFLWGYVKSCVYVNNPHTITQFNAEIRCVIDQIQAELCTSRRKFCPQVDVCREDIYLIFCFMFNRSLCASYWHNNISYHQINVFYY